MLPTTYLSNLLLTTRTTTSEEGEEKKLEIFKCAIIIKQE